MKTNWTNVEIWDSDGNLVTDDDDRRKLLREYRDTGGIWQHWLVDPADYTEETCGRWPTLDPLSRKSTGRALMPDLDSRAALRRPLSRGQTPRWR